MAPTSGSCSRLVPLPSTHRHDSSACRKRNWLARVTRRRRGRSARLVLVVGHRFGGTASDAAKARGRPITVYTLGRDKKYLRTSAGATEIRRRRTTRVVAGRLSGAGGFVKHDVFGGR